jgi:hypothetical protein
MTEPGRTRGLVHEALWQVDGELEQGGWDQDPRLFLVMADDAQRLAGFVRSMTGRELDAGQAVGTGIALAELTPFGQLVQQAGGDVPTALMVMGQALRQAIGSRPRPGPPFAYGAVLTAEAWMLRDADQHVAALERGDDVKIAEHPHRVEVRMTSFVGRDGHQAMLVHERDGIAELHDDRGGLGPDGRVPEGLTFFLASVLGRPVGPGGRDA